MTLIIEDGSIVENANSYVSLADCIAYHESRGNSFDSSPIDLMEQAIIRATSYIDNYYRSKIGGRKVERTQSLAFPRLGLEDEDGYEIPGNEIPKEIVKACCEASLIELNEPNSLTPIFEGGKRVLSESVNAGTVSTSTTYKDSDEYRKTVTIIDDLLKSFLIGGWTIGVIRN